MMQKRPVDNSSLDKKQNKKNRVFNARLIRAETTSTNFFKDGKLDVPAFINSRKFEIDQLEKSQLGSKNSQSTRVFQSLPRSLRRRNASHNVKRIPKRLRNRAIREMLSSKSKELKFKSDLSDVNLKKLTNRKKGKHNAKSVYKLKQRRTLLKLAAKWKLRKYVPASLIGSGLNLRKMIRFLKTEISASQASDDLKKRLVPITGNYGSYDNSGVNKLAGSLAPKVKYLKRSKNFSWLSTHIWHAKRFHMLKRWGWNIPYKPTQKCFRLVHRNLKNTGAIMIDTSYESKIMIKSNIKDYEDIINWLRKIFIRKTIKQSTTYYHGIFYDEKTILTKGMLFMNIFENSISILLQFHPADFQKVWAYLNEKFKSTVNDIIDCRYSLGSIDLLGPKSLNALVSTLHPIDKLIDEKWGYLNKISDIKSFGSKSIISFEMTDPRYFKSKINRRNNKFSTDNLLDLIISIKNKEWCSKKVIHDLLSCEGRSESYKFQYTTKQINKMMKKLPSPDIINLLSASESSQVTADKEESLSNTRIPVMIVFLEDRFKVIAPWFWINPIWQKLCKIPKVFPAGYIQLQQACLESSKPFYPNDFPTSATGYVEGSLSGIASVEAWKKRPKSKRISYKNIIICNYDEKHYKHKGELGDWNVCDWEFLKYLISLYLIREELLKRKENVNLEAHQMAALKHNLNFLETTNSNKGLLTDIIMLKKMQAESLSMNHDSTAGFSNLPIIDSTDSVIDDFKKTIWNTISNYQYVQISKLILPVLQVKITIFKTGKIKENCRIYAIPQKMLRQIQDFPNDIKITELDCPSFVNLRGFVTSSTMDLSSGAYIGFGCISGIYNNFAKDENFCILRNSGSNTCYIGCLGVI